MMRWLFLFMVAAGLGAATDADARSRKAKAVKRPIVTALAPTMQPQAQERADSRYALGDLGPVPDGTDPDAIHVKWRLTKLKVRVPFSLN